MTKSIIKNNIIDNIKKSPKNELMLMICVASIFLPYVLTCIVLGIFLIYLFTNQIMMKKIISTKRNYIVFAFMALALIVPACYKRWVSVAAGLLVIFILLFFLYAQLVMTEKLFQKICDISCIMSLVCFAYAVVEKFLYTWKVRS
ncbi:MAG: hypothetical protein RSA79_04995, partial [Oscillospiraceae bacterium]